MKLLYTVSGHEILVSDKDYKKVSLYRWYLERKKNTNYVKTHSLYMGKVRWFYIHQLILGTVACGHKLQIDHKNHNGVDNRRKNIKIVTHSDNIKNRRKHRGASIYTGVSKHSNNKWLARININGKQKSIGVFINEIDAAKAYNKAALKTGNKFYMINKFDSK